MRRSTEQQPGDWAGHRRKLRESRNRAWSGAPGNWHTATGGHYGPHFIEVGALQVTEQATAWTGKASKGGSVREDGDRREAKHQTCWNGDGERHSAVRQPKGRRHAMWGGPRDEVTGNRTNPRVGSRMQQACSLGAGENRRGREKRRGRNM